VEIASQSGANIRDDTLPTSSEITNPDGAKIHEEQPANWGHFR
jgi:hypothetical protein